MHGVTADPSTLEACGPRPGPRQLRDKASPIPAQSSLNLPDPGVARGLTPLAGTALLPQPPAGQRALRGPGQGARAGSAGAQRSRGCEGHSGRRAPRDGCGETHAQRRRPRSARFPSPPQVPRVFRRRLRAGLETPPAGQRAAPPPPDSYAASAFGRPGLGPSMDSDEDDDTRESRTATVSHGGRPTRRSLRHRALAPRGTLRHVTPGQQGPGEVTSRGPGRGLEGGCCSPRSSRGGRSPSPVLGAAERREPANPGGTGPRGGPASERGCWPVLRQAARAPCFQNPSLPFPRELEP